MRDKFEQAVPAKERSNNLWALGNPDEAKPVRWLPRAVHSAPFQTACNCRVSALT